MSTSNNNELIEQSSDNISNTPTTTTTISKKRTYNFKSEDNRKRRSNCLKQVRKQHLIESKVAGYQLELEMINNYDLTNLNAIENLIKLLEEKDKVIKKLTDINKNLIIQLNKELH